MITTIDPRLTYLPLRRRAWLVKAFAALVRALPEKPRFEVALGDMPAHLRRDLGLPPTSPQRAYREPPPLGGSGLM